ncbi:MAG: MBG domain-containing protein, partial [Erysipelotrichaceae bacterium]|nr:MBG domain-containing protein [Erysipelotrichaceae bacterium]
YEVVAKLEGTANYASAQSAKKAFTITKAESTLEISYAQNSFIYGSEVPHPTVTTNRNDAEVTFRWYRAEAPDTALAEKPSEVGDYLVEAYVEENENYLAQTTDPIAFAITKKHSTIIIQDDLSKAYDGQPVETPKNVETTGSTGAVSFEWYTADGTKLAEAPVNAGSYKVKAILVGDANYEGVEVEKDFTISQAKNEWITELSIENWGYGTTANTPQAEAQFGTVSYTYSTSEDGTYTEEVPSDAGTYWVKAVVEGTNNYEGLEAKVTFQITQATSTVSINSYDGKPYDGTAVSNPTDVVTTGSDGAVTFEWFAKDENGQWKSLGEQAPVNAGNYGVKAHLAANQNYAGADSGEPTPFEITKVTSSIAIQDDLSKEYDGQPVATPKNVETTGSTGAVSFEWYTADGTKLAEAPMNVGNYKVKAILAGDENYESAETEVEFSISKASNAWTTELSMQGWVYGEEANTPQAEVQFGKITYTYSTSEDGVYTEEVPSDAGTYWVKASVEGTDNYEGLEAKVSFTIEKANSSITIDTD